MATVQIFSYKNYVGALSDIENGNFINDINDGMQLGVVVKSQEIEITSLAIDAIKNVKRAPGTFAPIMVTKSDPSVVDQYGEYTIALFGFRKHAFSMDDEMISRDCDLTGLDTLTINDDIEIPQDFKEFVDEQLQ